MTSSIEIFLANPLALPGLRERPRAASKATLREHLAGKRAIVVGEAAEAPGRFFSCAVESGDDTIEIGLIVSDLGPAPAAVTLDRGRAAVVGHDASLTWVDLDQRRIAAEKNLHGAFYEFLSADAADVVVVHELGALRVDARGVEKGSVDTEVVEGHELDGSGNLILSIMERPAPVVVSIASGQRVDDERRRPS